MPTLADRETALYDDAWALPAYAAHAPGEHYVSVLREYCPPPAHVLDAGTGSGKGALALGAAGYTVTLCDLTDSGLVPAARALTFRRACVWRPLRPQLQLGCVDAVYCTDVLEHLPEALTLLAVDQLLRIALRGVLISVSTQPDAFGAWVGRPLHQTVRPFVWWRDMLGEIGRVDDARDLVGPAVFWVTRS
jgi:SAM-dependent methyltransferase